MLDEHRREAAIPALRSARDVIDDQAGIVRRLWGRPAVEHGAQHTVHGFGAAIWLDWVDDRRVEELKGIRHAGRPFFPIALGVNFVELIRRIEEGRARRHEPKRGSEAQGERMIGKPQVDVLAERRERASASDGRWLRRWRCCGALAISHASEAIPVRQGDT